MGRDCKLPQQFILIAFGPPNGVARLCSPNSRTVSSSPTLCHLAIKKSSLAEAFDGGWGEKTGQIITNTLKNIKNYLEFFIDFL